LRPEKSRDAAAATKTRCAGEFIFYFDIYTCSLVGEESKAMISNRSVPTDTVLPHVLYQDLDEAIAWLSRAFGFSEHYRYGEPASGAQMRLGNAWIMVRRAREGQESPARLGYGTQSLTVFVEDVGGHFQRAKAAGAKILEEPHETEYGEYQFAAEDLDGHHWLFSRHARDVSPDDWGAKIARFSATAADRF
jgi:uncharacterized glyoxalase superfamily protein PhnB